MSQQDATFICTHACIHASRHVKKGQIVTVPADALKLPLNAALLGPSFRRLHEETAAPAPEAKTRADLLQRLAGLKVTPPKKATVAELQALLASAADPAGAPTP